MTSFPSRLEVAGVCELQPAPNSQNRSAGLACSSDAFQALTRSLASTTYGSPTDRLAGRGDILSGRCRSRALRCARPPDLASAIGLGQARHNAAAPAGFSKDAAPRARVGMARQDLFVAHLDVAPLVSRTRQRLDAVRGRPAEMLSATVWASIGFISMASIPCPCVVDSRRAGRLHAHQLRHLAIHPMLYRSLAPCAAHR
jgi:hypothetical protein